MVQTNKQIFLYVKHIEREREGKCYCVHSNEKKEKWFIGMKQPKALFVFSEFKNWISVKWSWNQINCFCYHPKAKQYQRIILLNCLCFLLFFMSRMHKLTKVYYDKFIYIYYLLFLLQFYYKKKRFQMLYIIEV